MSASRPALFKVYDDNKLMINGALIGLLVLFPVTFPLLVLWLALSFQLVALSLEVLLLVWFSSSSWSFRHFNNWLLGHSAFLWVDTILVALCFGRLVVYSYHILVDRFHGQRRRQIAVVIAFLSCALVLGELLFEDSRLSAGVESLNVAAEIKLVIAAMSVIMAVGEFWIPTSYRDLEQSEIELYKAYGFPDLKPRLCVTSGLSFVKVNKKGISSDKIEGPVLVLTHGYLAGKALYVNSFEMLREHFTIFAVDWPGMGLSKRSLRWWFMKTSSQGSAEDIFIDALELWRKQRGIDKFYLGGHSFGGYLSARYAMKYPNTLLRLYLISPVGVPIPKALVETTFFKIASFLWNMRFTLNVILRVAGPLSKQLFLLTLRRRFHGSVVKHFDFISQYSYHINSAPVSGEIGLLLMFTAVARAISPLIKEIGLINCPTTFLYGADDWMDKEAGKDAHDLLRDQRMLPSRYYIISKAGHQIFLQNPDAFCKVIVLDSGLVDTKIFDDDQFQYDASTTQQVI